MKLLMAAMAGLLGVDAPPLAVVLEEGRVTRVHGLAGNFVRGEAGEAALAYSFDGDTEWRLEPGRLVARRGAVEAVLAVTAEWAEFREDTARLPDGRVVALRGDQFVDTGEAGTRIAGRGIVWREGTLAVSQPDGTVETAACPTEPESLTAAGPDWAHFPGHLLRLTPGRVALYVLPARSRGR